MSVANLIDAAKLLKMQFIHIPLFLVDLSDVSDFRKNHIVGSINVPRREVGEKMATLNLAKSAPLVIYDQDGVLVAEDVEKFEALGFINVVGLEGGLRSYLLEAPPTSIFSARE